MKKALLISESSIYRDQDGKMIARGGGAACFHNIAKTLLELGVEPTVFSIKEFEGQKVDEILDGVIYRRREVHSRSSWKLLSYLRRAYKDAKDYDMVFLNQFTPHLLLPFLKKKKNFVVIHDVYRDRGVKFWIQQFGFFVGLIGSLIERIQLNFDKKYADKIMTVSEGSKKKIVKELGKDIESKLFVNPYPIDQEEYQVGEKKEKILLFVGRFVLYKRPEDVLYALKKVLEKHPGYKAVFIVSRAKDEVKENFNFKKEELGLSDDEVVLMDCCCGDELKKWLSRAMILVQSSEVEGQGIVVLEALAAGTPVVGYDLEAYEKMLVSGKNSELVELGNVEKFAEAVVKVLNNYDFYQENTSMTLKYFSKEKFKKVLEEMCF